MKILVDHGLPFMLAHGGMQIQIEQTKTALERIGLEVEYLRWWDANQSGDIVHYFGRPHATYIEFAHSKHIKVVMAELLGGLSARSSLSHLLQRLVIETSQLVLPEMFTSRLGWKSYKRADAIIANTAGDADLMKQMFDAPSHRLHIVPNGVESVFFSQGDHSDPWLVCTATITQRKRVMEIVEAAILAQTPLWIIGRPYSESDSYFKRFLKKQQENKDLIRYEGEIIDRASLANAYRKARGFVLLSTMETRSLSSEEAAASGCPLLLSDLPWARNVFGADATYTSPKESTSTTAHHLRRFYDDAPSLPRPAKPKTWDEVAVQLKGIYEAVCRTS